MFQSKIDTKTQQLKYHRHSYISSQIHRNYSINPTLKPILRSKHVSHNIIQLKQKKKSIRQTKPLFSSIQPPNRLFNPAIFVSPYIIYTISTWPIKQIPVFYFSYQKKIKKTKKNNISNEIIRKRIN